MPHARTPSLLLIRNGRPAAIPHAKTPSPPGLQVSSWTGLPAGRRQYLTPRRQDRQVRKVSSRRGLPAAARPSVRPGSPGQSKLCRVSPVRSDPAGSAVAKQRPQLHRGIEGGLCGRQRHGLSAMAVRHAQ